MIECVSLHISDHSPSSKGREKQFLLYAATITILIIAIACTYGYSKTSFSALQPYGGLYLCLLLTIILLSNPCLIIFKPYYFHALGK